MSEKELSVDVSVSVVLFVVFLVLKLTGIIAWSWWWVTAPLWIPAAFVFVVFVVLCVISLIASIAAIAS